MSEHIIQVKVHAILDLKRQAADTKEALAIGEAFKWKDLLYPGVQVADGQYAVVGAWDNECWALSLEPLCGITSACSRRASVVALLKMLVHTFAVWWQQCLNNPARG